MVKSKVIKTFLLEIQFFFFRWFYLWLFFFFEWRKRKTSGTQRTNSDRYWRKLKKRRKRKRKSSRNKDQQQSNYYNNENRPYENLRSWTLIFCSISSYVEIQWVMIVINCINFRKESQEIKKKRNISLNLIDRNCS